MIKTNLKVLMAQQDRTVTALANDIGVDRVTVSQWRSGTQLPSYENLNALCRVLGCQVGDILVYVPDSLKAESAETGE